MMRLNNSNPRPVADHVHSDGVDKAVLKKNPAGAPAANAGAGNAAVPGQRLNRNGEPIPRHASEPPVRPGPDGSGEVPVSLQTSPRSFEPGMVPESQRFPRGNFDENPPVFRPDANAGAGNPRGADARRETGDGGNYAHPFPLQDEPHSRTGGHTVSWETAVPKHLSREEKQQMRRLQGNQTFIEPNSSRPAGEFSGPEFQGGVV